MNRRDWLRSVALGSTSLWGCKYVTAQTADLTLQPLTENFHVLIGAGGNITILNTAEGLLVCDSGLPNTADAMVGKVKSVAAAPVKVLIDTHWHSDHTGGNVALAAAGAEIVAHTNTLKRVSTNQHMLFFNRDVAALPAAGLPKKTFTGSDKMTFSTETIEIVHHPVAHTDGDTTVFFPKANVFVTGDLLFNGMYPFIDYSSDGLIEGVIRNSAEILKLVDDQTKIVPGHGPIANKADVQKFHDMLGSVNASLSTQIKQGKTIDEILAASPTKPFDADWGNGFLKPDQFVKMLYQGKTKAGINKAA